MITSQLIQKAQLGDETSLQEVFEDFNDLIHFSVKRFFIAGGDKEDVIQEARVGLLKAIKPSLTPSEIEVILKSTATSMGDTSLYGAWRVNACKAVAQALWNDPNTICSTDWSTTTKKYACSGTSCVESATGNYSTSSCDNMCGATDWWDGSIKKTYLCKETQCVEDFSGNGTFTEPSCGGSCSSTLPQPVKNTYSCENNLQFLFLLH